MAINRVDFLMTILMLTVVTPIQACTDGWLSFGDSCYHKPQQKANFINAKSSCEKLNAGLVSINSEAENNFVYDHFFKMWRWFYIDLVREEAGSDVFVKSSGEEQKYFNWRKNQPNNYGGNENCVEMRRRKWNDIPCSRVQNFVCEKSEGGCHSNPCQNGGDCKDVPEGGEFKYKCICPPRFTGRNCELKFAGCEEGWIANGNDCYRSLNGVRPWTVGMQDCVNIDAELAFPKTADENAFINTKFSQPLDRAVWLGITECPPSSQCSIDYGNLEYKDWGPLEPKDLGDKKGCAMMEPGTGVWMNKDCDEKYTIVCKKTPVKTA